MIEKVKLSNIKSFSFDADITGKVFFYEDKIFRGINKERVNDIKEMFECGLISELEGKNLIPHTRIAEEYEIDGFALLLEHEKILTCLYPAQWGISMFQDACSLVLRVNQIALRFGFALQDAHGYNVMFDHSNPKYVDIGSFLKVPIWAKAIYAFREEYIEYFHLILKIGAEKDYRLFRTLLNSYQSGVSLHTYLNYKIGSYFLFSNTLKSLAKFFLTLKFSGINFSSAIWKVIRNKILNKRCTANIRPHDFSNYRKPIKEFNHLYFYNFAKNIKIDKMNSFWGNYHAEIKLTMLTATPRFNAILEIIRELKISSAIDIGGNQGLFTELMLKNSVVEDVLCVDYDEDALNVMYTRFKEQKIKATPCYLNFVFPALEELGRDLYTRLQKDLAIMLALTHHLILTQYMPLSMILDRLKRFATKFVIVEFMPLGLYDPDHPHYSIAPPNWYTLNWFKEEFIKHFELIKFEQLEKNRILFVGKIKKYFISN